MTTRRGVGFVFALIGLAVLVSAAAMVVLFVSLSGGGGPHRIVRKQVGIGFPGAPVADTWLLADGQAEGLVAVADRIKTTSHQAVAELRELPARTATLPIACVEGWSTTQTWTGVRLRDLAALAGVPAPSSAVVRSLENGPFAPAAPTRGGAARRPRRSARRSRCGRRGTGRAARGTTSGSGTP